MPQKFGGEENESKVFEHNDAKLFKLMDSTDKAEPQSSPHVTASAPAFGSKAVLGQTPAKSGTSGDLGADSGNGKNGADKKNEGSATKKAWMERGVGRVYINVANEGGGARIVMRMKGTHAVMLNTPISMSKSFEPVGNNSVRFMAAENVNGSWKLGMCRLNLGSTDTRDAFVVAARGLLK